MQTDPTEAADFRMMVELEERRIALSTFQTPLLEIIAWDATTGAVVAANEAAQNGLGLQLRQLIKMNIGVLFDGLVGPRFDKFLNAVKRRKSQAAAFYAEFHDRIGGIQFLRVHLRFQYGGRPTFVATIQNMSGYDAARSAARHAEKMLATALESLPDGFVLFDENDRLVICNDRYRDIYPESAPAMVRGASFAEILRYGLEKGQYVEAIGREEDWLRARLAVHKTLNSTVEQRLSTGRWLRIVERTTPDGGRVGLRIDITEMKQNQRKLEQAACTDHLTGLLNRRGLMEALDVLTISLADNDRIAVLHCDLDKFKSVNDEQGHAAGDFVLQHCATILQDSVDSDAVVARVGGDEFIVLLVVEEDDRLATEFAQNLIVALGKPVQFHDRLCHVGASVGIAFFDPFRGAKIEATLTDADIALHEAKKSGKGRFRVFRNAMRDNALEHIQMTKQIKAGIEAGQFEPHFQPQVNSKTGEIIGFEALIRWQHPERGLVPAFQFILAAERSGLMDALDEVVLEQACQAVARMAEWGLSGSCVSVNLSIGQITAPDITERILHHVNVAGISPRNLRLELLESTLIDDDSSIIIDNVHRLIAAGFSVELDDFGTGHAAIATLRKFAVSRIKVDRSLVNGIAEDRELQVITGAIIGLADRLGVKVLAEGVETEAEQDMIQQLGCDSVQGYLHARPMPLEELEKWVIAR